MCGYRVTVVLAFLGVTGCDQVTSVRVMTDAAPVEARWTAFEAPAVSYFAVAGSAADDVLMVGEQGTILHWDGAALTQEPSGTSATLRGVSVVSAEEAFAVGDAGTVLRRTAGVWEPVAVGLATEALTSIWAGPAQVVAVGEAGAFLVGKGVDWKRIPNEYLEDLLAVTGDPGVVAVGALGMMLTLEGDKVRRRPIAQFSKPLAGATTGPGGRWFVGLEGSALRGQPDALSPVSGLPPRFLRSVTAPGPDVWIVGWDGIILRLVGNTPERVEPYDDRWMNGVYASSSSDVWIVGRSGLVLHGPPPTMLPDAGTDSDAGGGA